MHRQVQSGIKAHPKQMAGGMVRLPPQNVWHLAQSSDTSCRQHGILHSAQPHAHNGQWPDAA